MGRPETSCGQNIAWVGVRKIKVPSSRTKSPLLAKEARSGAPGELLWGELDEPAEIFLLPENTHALELDSG